MADGPPAPPFDAARSVKLRALMGVAGPRCIANETSEGRVVLERSRVFDCARERDDVVARP